jgi:hypothetical protein
MLPEEDPLKPRRLPGLYGSLEHERDVEREKLLREGVLLVPQSIIKWDLE